MPEHFPTFNRAARLIRSARPGGRPLFQRIGQALATERGLLRAGLYGLMLLALSFHAVALLEAAFQAAGVPISTYSYYSPFSRYPSGSPDSLIGKALGLYAALLHALFGLPQFATLAIFACLVALVFTSERPSAAAVKHREPAEGP